MQATKNSEDHWRDQAGGSTKGFTAPAIPLSASRDFSGLAYKYDSKAPPPASVSCSRCGLYGVAAAHAGLLGCVCWMLAQTKRSAAQFRLVLTAGFASACSGARRSRRSDRSSCCSPLDKAASRVRSSSNFSSRRGSSSSRPGTQPLLTNANYASTTTARNR